MINEPKYDNEYTTKSYVDRVTSELSTEVITTKITIDGEIANINKTYGAPPNPPYFVGNLYVDGTNLYRCKTERLIGAFDAADWELATEYPTTSYVDSTYTKPADFLETGSVSVNGGRITAGSIKSAHYIENTSGMKIDLDQDIIDSKNFKVNSEGVVTATNAILSGTLTSNNVTITGGSLSIGSGNFVVTNAGTITANSINLVAGNITWNGFNKPTKSDLGAWTTWIGPDGIYTGTLTASQVNAVAISASSITTGTMSASRINGGTISGTNARFGNQYSGGIFDYYNGVGFLTLGRITEHPYVSALNISSVNNTQGINFRSGLNNSSVGYSRGSIAMNQSNGMFIYSSGTVNINTPTTGGGNVRIKDIVFSGRDMTVNGGAIGINGTSCWANGQQIVTSSSKATKTKIKELSQTKIGELYDLIKQIPIKEYDYKKKYGRKNNYGFLIEDIENTKLKSLLHVENHTIDKNIKTYSTEDLVRLQLIVIQELMKKVEILESRL